MPDWLDFEKMIARIYSTISEDCTVTHNDYLEGTESKTKRQIDVRAHFIRP